MTNQSKEEGSFSGGAECPHRYLTSFQGSGGWVCAACRVQILSLAIPIPLPLIAQAIEAVAGRALSSQSEAR